MRPVRRTLSPSLISLSGPMITTPTLSSSRFSATPCKPLGNSTSSDDAHAAQSVDARKIRADLDDGADFVFLNVGFEARNLLFENAGDFVSVDHSFVS